MFCAAPLRRPWGVGRARLQPYRKNRAEGATSLPKARGPRRTRSLGWEIGVRAQPERLNCLPSPPPNPIHPPNTSPTPHPHPPNQNHPERGTPHVRASRRPQDPRVPHHPRTPHQGPQQPEGDQPQSLLRHRLLVQTVQRHQPGPPRSHPRPRHPRRQNPRRPRPPPRLTRPTILFEPRPPFASNPFIRPIHAPAEKAGVSSESIPVPPRPLPSRTLRGHTPPSVQRICLRRTRSEERRVG